MMELDEAKTLLEPCLRHENFDDTFEDAEVWWFNDRTLVATGYFNETKGVVMFVSKDGEFVPAKFRGDDAYILLQMGTQGRTTNDPLGGALSVEYILDELTKDAGVS